MTVSLPDSFREFVERQVATGGFPNAEAYVGALIEADLRRKAQEHLESLIIEGLDTGPATEMTSQDWDDIRRQGLARIRAGQPT